MHYGADPTLPAPRDNGRSAVAVAARMGRADALELFRRADEALYLAKRTGKRRVCLYKDVSAAPR